MNIEELPKDKNIILFDGVCNLCNSAVQYVIKKDKNDVFRFVALQSELGQKITNYIGVDTSKIDSIILYEPRIAYYYKAQAAFKILNKLGGVVSFFCLLNVLPDGINNKIYDYIAKNRNKWYGKKEQCIIPTPDMLAKFLS